MAASVFDIGLGLENTHVLITGGKGLIGRVVVQGFLAAGAKVSVVDLPGPQNINTSAYHDNVHYADADITTSIDAAFNSAEAKFGPVECCIALASLDLSVLPQTDSLCDADPAAWQRVFDVNINGTFLTCQRWLRGIRTVVEDEKTVTDLKNVSCILMGSEAGKFGVKGMAAYAAGKAAIQYGLLASLAQDVPKIYNHARCNAVAPSSVDTARFKQECKDFGEEWRWGECEATVGLGKPVSPEDVARTFLFLASERYSGGTHGQLLHVDGGKTGSIIWKAREKNAHA